MTAIERTAYPRLKTNSQYRQADLRLYIPTDEDFKLMRHERIMTDKMQLSFLLTLKTFQRLGYFIPLSSIPKVIIKQIRKSLSSPRGLKPGYGHESTKYRHRDIIRNYLALTQRNQGRDQLIEKLADNAAQTMNDPANIINVVIEELVKQRYELPAFSSLDKTVCAIRHRINDEIFECIYQRLTNHFKIAPLEKTLIKDSAAHTTEFHRFKRLPQKPTVGHFKELVEHHDWIMAFGDFSRFLKGISTIKLAQFAEEARSLDASAIKAMRDHAKQFSLIACLLAQSQCRAKDALGLTFSRVISSAEKTAIRKYDDQARNKEAVVVDISQLLMDMASDFKGMDHRHATTLIKQLQAQYENYGGADKVIADCEQVLGKANNKHLPLMYDCYKSNRSATFDFLKSASLQGIKSERPLLLAIDKVEQIRNTKNVPEWLELDEAMDLSFAPKNWHALIARNENKSINIKHFEVCVMAQLCEKLRTSDIYIQGGDAYGDYRQALLPWHECLPFLDEFCQVVNIPNNASELVKNLKAKLTNKIKKIDNDYPSITAFDIDDQGVPTLKKPNSEKKTNVDELRNVIKRRMPQRTFLDVMCLIQNCSEWANCLSPLSGSDSKLSDPISANIVTAFGYGTGMGPAETARHVRANFSEKTIGNVNKRHVNVKKLNNAIAKVVDYYAGFPLVKIWGDGNSVAVDGTLRKIYEQNLLAETHIRYGAKGGIAYHHVSNNYIALFSSFISCGTWEAIAIIDGLLNNQSKEIKPKKVHGDTQSQSAPVFSLSYLFGIELMPRIRNWKNLVLYKPTKSMKLKHIGSLFSGTIDWRLIENYWQDMMQVVISIQQGKVSSDLILSKLNSRNNSSTLYAAFRELGNALRTLFMLDFISDSDLRETITAETNKAESYNNLTDWVRFASDSIVASNNTTEMEKAIKYNTLLANIIILQNTIDMSRIIQQLRREGWSISHEELALLSPYLTEHLKRFGDFYLDRALNDGNIDRVKAEAIL